MEQSKVTSAIDPTKPVDGAPAVKADLRANLQSAKDEIEALQTGKTDFGHQHVLVDVTDSGALASKVIVQSEDIAAAAITTAKLADAAVAGTKLPDAVVTTVLLEAGSSSTGTRSSSSRPRHSRPTWSALTCSPGDPSLDMRVRHQETDDEEEPVQRGADHRRAA
jgi:hypothetical protein